MSARILVTGSRTWLNRRLLNAVLTAVNDITPITVVHGGAPRGADAMAHRWALANERDIEVYPERWSSEGRKTAGHIRNRRMVDTAPAAVVAFLAEEATPGTSGCISLVRAAGIKLAVFRPDSGLELPERWLQLGGLG